MTTLIGLLLLSGSLVLQSSLISHLQLLHGMADLPLLVLVAWLLHPRLPWPWAWAILTGGLVGWVSGLPWIVPLLAYTLVAALTLMLRGRLWQVSLLVYLFLVVSGTLLVQAITWAALVALGTVIPWRLALTQVVLPSALLNVLLALPTHGVVTEITAWALPEVEDAA